MRLNLFHIFSELVTGLACLSAFILCLYMYSPHGLDLLSKFEIHCSEFEFSHFLFFSIIIYFIGFIVDGIGLGLDRLFFDKEIINEEQRRNFFNKVSEQVLEYRDRQWAYYSSYRNLFLTLIPLSILTTIYICTKRGAILGILVLALFFLTGWIVWRTMKLLLEIYYSIERSF